MVFMHPKHGENTGKKHAPLSLAYQRMRPVRAVKGRDERATTARPCLRTRPAEENPMSSQEEKGAQAKAEPPAKNEAVLPGA